MNSTATVPQGICRWCDADLAEGQVQCAECAANDEPLPFPSPSDPWCLSCGGCPDRQDLEAVQMGVACVCREEEER